MSFWDDLFSSPRSKANENIYNDYNSAKNVGDIEKRYGLKRRKASDVSKVFNPARANLATRQAQANAAAGTRMSGSDATPQTTFGGINSQFANAFGDLESNAASKGLDVERSDEQLIADYFNRTKQQRDQAAQGLSETSPFNDILAVGGAVSKFVNPFSSTPSPNTSVGGMGKIDPSQFSGQDYSGFSMPTSLSPKTITSPLNSAISGVSDVAGDALSQSLIPAESVNGGEVDDGSWGMNKRHGYNNRLGKFGWWIPGNQDVNFNQ
jgi:hypothetical protein